jgi:hypothetical protein
VGGVVAVQVTDLAFADRECELTATAGACPHTRPAQDLIGDLLTRRLKLRHGLLLGGRKSGQRP